FFQIGAKMLVLARKLERLAEMPRILVAVESGLVGGDLEQHASRSAEVDRPEIVPVDHWRHLVACLQQRTTYLKLLVPVLDGKGDMVHRAGALPATADHGKRLD